MGFTRIINIQCTNCNNSFTSSVYCENDDNLNNAVRCENEIPCPLCGKITTWSMDNTEVTNEDGIDFRGNEIFI